MMQTPIDTLARHQQEMAEQAAASERARVQNVNRFVEMWLSLGVDCIRAAGSSHQPELAEALGLATNRWSRLLDAEAQVQREEQRLASRPKKRPAQPTDDTLPDRTIEKTSPGLGGTNEGSARRSRGTAQAHRERAQRTGVLHHETEMTTWRRHQ